MLYVAEFRPNGSNAMYQFQPCQWCGWNEAASIESYIDHCLNDHLLEESDGG